MDTLQIIAMLVVFILLLLFVYYFFKDDKGITSGLNDARYYKYIDPKEFGVPAGLKAAFATSIWVYIKDNASGAHGNGNVTRDRIIYYIVPIGSSIGFEQAHGETHRRNTHWRNKNVENLHGQPKYTNLYLWGHPY